jgi:hypothetical protein
MRDSNEQRVWFGSMQYELAHIEEPHITCWHKVSSHVKCHHEKQGAHHGDDNTVVDLAAYSERKTNTYCCSSSRIMMITEFK